ncbi:MULTISPECIES: hypothetical protein [unclassified Dietzia]|nr:MULTISPECIES: hypothetical protein [unclassified Dietzia]
MRTLAWVVWHLARAHLFTVGRPYDAPVGVYAHCRCGDNHQLL